MLNMNVFGIYATHTYTKLSVLESLVYSLYICVGGGAGRCYWDGYVGVRPCMYVHANIKSLCIHVPV